MTDPQTLQGGVRALPDADLIAEIKRRVADGAIQIRALGFDHVCADCGDYLEQAVSTVPVEASQLTWAHSYWVQRNIPEMLWCLEKALGSAFSGLSEIKPEQLK